MKQIFNLLVLVGLSTTLPVLAEDPQSYALDKLANAEAQLERLSAQRKAIDQMIRAVREDLRAAKIRAKAEKLQVEADSKRGDATAMVQQAGVAIDLPNLMMADSNSTGVTEYAAQKEEIDLMFKDKPKEEAVFFPASARGRKSEIKRSGLDNDADIKYSYK